jgi:hypothetical protein
MLMSRWCQDISAISGRNRRMCGGVAFPRRLSLEQPVVLIRGSGCPNPVFPSPNRHVYRLHSNSRDLDCRALRLRVCRGRELPLVILVFGGIDAGTFLHLFISCGVTDRIVCAGPEPRFCLVLLALPAARILCGTKRRRDILCFGTPDGEWSSLQFRWLDRRASHASFRVAGDGYQSRER